MSTATLAAPAPLNAKVFRHPLKWMRNHLQKIFYVLLFAHIGEFIIAALYYLLTQKSQTMNNGWHQLVSDSNLRHAIRDVGEGVLGGLLAQGIVYNYFKKGNRKVGKVTGLLKAKLHIPVTLAAFVSAAIFGAIAFMIGYEILNLFHPHSDAAVNSGSLWHRTYTNLWATNFPKKVLGLVAAFGARKPMRVVFANAQAWFVERRIDSGRKVRWYHPPTFQARYNYLTANPDDRHVGYSTTQNIVMALLTLAGLGLAGYGYYILTYIA